MNSSAKEKQIKRWSLLRRVWHHKGRRMPRCWMSLVRVLNHVTSAVCIVSGKMLCCISVSNNVGVFGSEKTITLLAFSDNASSPLCALLEPTQRQKIAAELNAAILSSQRQVTKSQVLCSTIVYVGSDLPSQPKGDLMSLGGSTMYVRWTSYSKSLWTLLWMAWIPLGHN